MKLEWIGHSCFRMTAQDGTVAITDPYDGSVGIRMVALRADLITMSHEHHDHNHTEMIEGSPVIAHGAEPAQAGSVSATAVASWHDDVGGQKRGPNAIRIFAIDGLKIVHMGDQGCMPDDAAFDAIRGADVMLIPVGGFYTVDGETAAAIVRRAEPRCVVPMHFKTASCGYPISDVRPFLAAMGAGEPTPAAQATFLPGSGPEGVLLMQPETDAL